MRLRKFICKNKECGYEIQYETDDATDLKMPAPKHCRQCKGTEFEETLIGKKSVRIKQED